MNTKFKILWFEDEVLWFNMEKIRIEKILSEHNLIPKITRKDGEDFDLEEIKGNDYDLIIMDYKLADGVTGDTIVSALRDQDVLTDVLFYSSQHDDMLDAIYRNHNPIDGIYFTEREYNIFSQKAKNLIRKIVRRSEDVVNLRGFVLDNTSDFEVRIKAILDVCWNKFTDDQKKSLTNSIIKILVRKRDSAFKTIDTALSSSTVFTYSNSQKYLLNVSDRLEIMNKVLEILFDDYNFKDQFKIKNFKKYYYSKIGTYRNCLGHVSADEKSITIDKDVILLNQDFHKLMRQNITEVDNLVSIVETFISEKL